MKQILIIGGTGIIGKPTVFQALQSGYEVTTVGLNRAPEFPESVRQIVVDRNDSDAFRKRISELDQKWDVVFDVYNLGKSHAVQVHELFQGIARHVFVISTTLVYDRSKPSFSPIPSNQPLAKLGTMGGYVDQKLSLERYWQAVKDLNWTILRPYHIVGAGSLLGCVPMHNRDPELLDRIQRGQPLALCSGGNSTFNFIHPKDIASIVLRSAGNPKTFRKSYNAVNPEKILAKNYYYLIGNVLGKKVLIENKPIREVWDEQNGWVLTTLPHEYDVSDLERDVGFVPSIPLEKSIREAIQHYPTKNKKRATIPIHQRMTLPPFPKKINWLLT